MNKEFDYNVLDEILKEHNYDESHTVTILQEVQAHYSYLPKEAFPYLAEKLGVPEAKIYGLAPVITVNGKVYSQMTKEKAAEVLKELREEN